MVVVDWSASTVPARGRDSIWAAHWRARGRGPHRLDTANLATRSMAYGHVSAILARAARSARTVLVAVDFSLGYPAGFASCTAALGGEWAAAPSWARTWSLLSALVEDGPDNANNRFAVAERINRRTGTRLFWGRPRSARFEHLSALPPTDRVPAGLAPNPCPTLRVTERLAGRGIRSNFQLFGGVTVGGQVMVGIPWLHRLLAQFRDLAVVWPFETGFTPDPIAGEPPGLAIGPAIGPAAPPPRRFVFAELWPSAFGPAPPATGRPVVRDEAQVVAAARACARRDAAGWAAWFDPAAAAALPARQRTSVLDEEGWILGVG